MNKKIKFRAWNGKEMELLDSFFELQKMNKTESELKNLKLMQFTGLHDKNGKDIYEGDIVKHNGLVREDETLMVEFKDGSFCLTGKKLEWIENESCTIRDLMFQAKRHNMKLELEIIGNIHEGEK